MQNFLKIASGADVMPLLMELQRQPELWGQNSERKYVAGTPHSEMTDIWIRYNDRRPFDKGERPFSEINDAHDSVWYPAADKLPSVRPLIFGLMARVQGERLGGVLITRIPPGGKLEAHIDCGWHAGHYDKYYIALQNEPGAGFWFESDGGYEVMSAQAGDVHWFRNDVLHGVNNDSPVDRLAMIVCIEHGRPWQ